MRNDVFQQITDSIAAQLEQGVRPWSQPWTATQTDSRALPHNIAGRSYRGANVFWLWLIGQQRGYETPCWLTYKQAEAAGGNVRKGEKGSDVFFWKVGKVEDKETGEERKSFLVRQYKVFNIAQTEGIELPAEPKPAERPEPERIAAAEAMIAATGADIRHGGGEAFYMPSLDRVQMPPREAFHNADGYYSTLFHEVGHWTGHESRLNRTFGKRFGDDAYAFEELVAELTAAFVCSSQGFASIERPDHAAYIGDWLNVLKGDKRAFVTAAAAAQRAADLILGKAKAEAEAEPVAEAA